VSIAGVLAPPEIVPQDVVYRNCAEVKGATVTPYITKSTVPTLVIVTSFVNAVTDGVGRVRFCPAVVWLMLNEFEISTVTFAAAISPPVGLLAIDTGVRWIAPSIVRFSLMCIY
jgi:hypothetical protein